MGRLALILLAVMVVAAVVGFMVDTVRVIAGFAFMVCLIVLVARMFAKKS